MAEGDGNYKSFILKEDGPDKKLKTESEAYVPDKENVMQSNNEPDIKFETESVSTTSPKAAKLGHTYETFTQDEGESLEQLQADSLNPMQSSDGDEKSDEVSVTDNLNSMQSDESETYSLEQMQSGKEDEVSENNSFDHMQLGDDDDKPDEDSETNSLDPMQLGDEDEELETNSLDPMQLEDSDEEPDEKSVNNSIDQMQVAELQTQSNMDKDDLQLQIELTSRLDSERGICVVTLRIAFETTVYIRIEPQIGDTWIVFSLIEHNSQYSGTRVLGAVLTPTLILNVYFMSSFAGWNRVIERMLRAPVQLYRVPLESLIPDPSEREKDMPNDVDDVETNQDLTLKTRWASVLQHPQHVFIDFDDNSIDDDSRHSNDGEQDEDADDECSLTSDEPADYHSDSDSSAPSDWSAYRDRMLQQIDESTQHCAHLIWDLEQESERQHRCQQRDNNSLHSSSASEDEAVENEMPTRNTAEEVSAWSNVSLDLKSDFSIPFLRLTGEWPNWTAQEEREIRASLRRSPPRPDRFSLRNPENVTFQAPDISVPNPNLDPFYGEPNSSHPVSSRRVSFARHPERRSNSEASFDVDPPPQGNLNFGAESDLQPSLSETLNLTSPNIGGDTGEQNNSQQSLGSSGSSAQRNSILRVSSDQNNLEQPSNDTLTLRRVSFPQFADDPTSNLACHTSARRNIVRTARNLEGSDEILSRDLNEDWTMEQNSINVYTLRHPMHQPFTFEVSAQAQWAYENDSRSKPISFHDYLYEIASRQAAFARRRNVQQQQDTLVDNRSSPEELSDIELDTQITPSPQQNLDDVNSMRDNSSEDLKQGCASHDEMDYDQNHADLPAGFDSAIAVDPQNDSVAVNPLEVESSSNDDQMNFDRNLVFTDIQIDPPLPPKSHQYSEEVNCLGVNSSEDLNNGYQSRVEAIMNHSNADLSAGIEFDSAIPLSPQGASSNINLLEIDATEQDDPPIPILDSFNSLGDNRSADSHHEIALNQYHADPPAGLEFHSDLPLNSQEETDDVIPMEVDPSDDDEADEAAYLQCLAAAPFLGPIAEETARLQLDPSMSISPPRSVSPWDDQDLDSDPARTRNRLERYQAYLFPTDNAAREANRMLENSSEDDDDSLEDLNREPTPSLGLMNLRLAQERVNRSLSSDYQTLFGHPPIQPHELNTLQLRNRSIDRTRRNRRPPTPHRIVSGIARRRTRRRRTDNNLNDQVQNVPPYRGRRFVRGMRRCPKPKEQTNEPRVVPLALLIQETEKQIEQLKEQLY